MPSYEKILSVPGKSANDIFAKVDSEIDRFLSKANLGNAEVNRNKDSLTIEVKSAMFTGKLQSADQQMKVSGKLSLLALPFKSKLDEGLEKWVAKFLA